MAVSKSQYKIIKKAVIIRIGRGENYIEVINSYSKLSDIQKEDMIIELTDEGYISQE